MRNLAWLELSLVVAVLSAFVMPVVITYFLYRYVEKRKLARRSNRS